MSVFPEPIAISRSQRLAVFDDDVVRSFANMIDADGDKTDDADEALVVVVPVLDKWMVIDLRQFEPVGVN